MARNDKDKNNQNDEPLEKKLLKAGKTSFKSAPNRLCDMLLPRLMSEEIRVNMER